MLTITCEPQEPVFYTFDLFMHDLPKSPPLRASVSDSALAVFVFAAPSARWEHVVVVTVWKATPRFFGVYVVVSGYFGTSELTRAHHCSLSASS